MSPQSLADRTYRIILDRMIETGVAPHYTEIAAKLGVIVPDGRKALYDLMGLGIPGMWLFPDTDYISSFAPFSNLPTQYRISVDGEQNWHGQWGFESLAVSWLYPGKMVTIDAPCLDCGKPVRIEMRDGAILNVQPKETCGYVAVPFAKWLDRLPYAWSTMNLFRSEEHVREWSGYVAGTDQGIIPLDRVAKLFSGNFFKRRSDPDYVSKSGQYIQEFLAALAQIGPFWAPAPRAKAA